MTAHKVTQADREAAATYAESDGEFYVNASDRAEYCRAVREGEIDADMLVQAFAAHRIAHEPKWLPIEDATAVGKKRHLFSNAKKKLILVGYRCPGTETCIATGHGRVPMTHYIPLDTLPTLPEEPAIRAMKGSKT